MNAPLRMTAVENGRRIGVVSKALSTSALSTIYRKWQRISLTLGL
jgi:hypothetical protein